MSSQQLAKADEVGIWVADPKSSLPKSTSLDSDAPEESSRPTDGKHDVPDGAQTIRIIITMLMGCVASLVSTDISQLLLCRKAARLRY